MRTLPRLTGPWHWGILNLTGSGSITVRAGTANLIQIRGTIRVQNHRNTREGAEAKVRALASNPPIEQSGSVIRIGRIEDRELRENVSISYEIVAPEETRLRARTGSGSQTVEGIRGPADIDTGSGSLTVSNIAGTVNARTGSGGIELRTVKGRVEASTGSGSIRASNIESGINARTGSGGVHVEQASGDADPHLVGARRSRLEVLGHVDLAVPDDAPHACSLRLLLLSPAR